MGHSVLLARPHPFLVSEMKPWLEQHGYRVARLETLDELPALARGSDGAVVSLALNSPLPASAEEVFRALRAAAPRLPVVFASLLPFEQAKPALGRLAEQAGIEAAVLNVESSWDTEGRLGTPRAFVYIAKDDLADPARREWARNLVARQFNGARRK